jgi:hypothetical protein
LTAWLRYWRSLAWWRLAVEVGGGSTPLERFINPSQPGRALFLSEERRTGMATTRECLLNRKQRKELARQLKSDDPGLLTLAWEG